MKTTCLIAFENTGEVDEQHLTDVKVSSRWSQKRVWALHACSINPIIHCTEEMMMMMTKVVCLQGSGWSGPSLSCWAAAARTDTGVWRCVCSRNRDSGRSAWWRIRAPPAPSSLLLLSTYVSTAASHHNITNYLTPFIQPGSKSSSSPDISGRTVAVKHASVCCVCCVCGVEQHSDLVVN